MLAMPLNEEINVFEGALNYQSMDRSWLLLRFQMVDLTSDESEFEGAGNHQDYGLFMTPAMVQIISM